MSTFHLGELVAGRDQLARVDWCGEGAFSGQMKSYQASSRLRGAAGCQGCTSSCCLPRARVMRGRMTSERGLRGCAHSKRGDGCRHVKGRFAWKGPLSEKHRRSGPFSDGAPPPNLY